MASRSKNGRKEVSEEMPSGRVWPCSGGVADPAGSQAGPYSEEGQEDGSGSAFPSLVQVLNLISKRHARINLLKNME
jgi:hypothetical protein